MHIYIYLFVDVLQSQELLTKVQQTNCHIGRTVISYLLMTNPPISPMLFVNENLVFSFKYVLFFGVTVGGILMKNQRNRL